MNAELTELVFILDRSGSMGGLESDTIGGFNGMIARQKKEGEKINVTTVLFDDEVEIVHDRFPIEIIEPLTDKEYYTYRFRPKLLANYLYGNGELYFIILLLNDIWSVKDFDFKTIKLIPKTQLSDVLSKINESEKDFIDLYNSSSAS